MKHFSEEFLSYGRQFIDDADVQAVTRVLHSENLTQGNEVRLFEEKLAAVCQSQYAVAVSNATAGLHLACLAAGVGPGKKILTSPISFVASANCALYCGGDVDFIDIDFKTGNLDANRVYEKLTPDTAAVIPVHYAGQSCNMAAIQEAVQLASKKFGKKIFIIEDAAHGLGGSYRKKPIGSCQHSDMAVMSFHPVKSIATGEGGAILTNSQKSFELLSSLRSHGIEKDEQKLSMNPGPWYYEQQHLGFNFRITDMQCALGSSQLDKLSRFLERRREISKNYRSAFEGKPGIQMLELEKDSTSANHLFVLLVDFKRFSLNKAELMRSLRERNIGTQVHYIPIYRQPFFVSKYNIDPAHFSNSEKFYEKCLSIPLYPALRDEQAETVSSAILEVLGL